MKVKVLFFAPFREMFGTGEREVDLADAPSVLQLLNFLCNSNEGRDKLFDDSGELRPHVTILKNGTSIKTLNGVHTELEEGDEIALFPPISGG